MGIAKATAFAVAVGMGLCGCLEMDGGAVEVSWVIRDAHQRGQSCSQAGIHQVRVEVIQQTDGGVVNLCTARRIGKCTFSCKDGNGATPFRIPSGSYYFGLMPLDSEGNEMSPGLVQVPVMARRSIDDGQMLDLGVWQMALTVP